MSRPVFADAEPTTQPPPPMTLPEYLRTTEIGHLSIEDRQLIVAQALLVLEQNYALLPFKIARYGINPLQRLRLMQTRLGRRGEPEPEWRFHFELVDIVNSLRDRHTRYTLPSPFSEGVAQLPFLVKEFTEDGRLRYLVSRRRADQPELDESFRFGVELTHWSGVPMARAIERLAQSIPGANPEARHALAVDRLTFRSLGYGPPPDEDWVTVRYIDLQGQVRDVRLIWDVRSIVPTPNDGATPTALDVPLGLDVEGARVARLRTSVFAPEVIAREESGKPVAGGPDTIEVSPELATVFEARRVTAGGRTFGHLRIRTFVPVTLTASGVGAFVREFIRLLANPTATYHDLGADYYTSRIDKERRKRHLVQQLEALGLQVTPHPGRGLNAPDPVRRLEPAGQLKHAPARVGFRSGGAPP